MPLNLFIAGQKAFGEAVYKACQQAGYKITGVACPSGGKRYDRLHKAAYVDKNSPLIIDSDKLLSSDIPDGTDVIIAAHSHHFISSRVRDRVKYTIGYHPSLLPRHRGRDAVRWTVKFGDSITGGTVYLLDDTVDGGPIIKQESILVDKHWDARHLWREHLFPMGIRLITRVLKDVEAGTVSMYPQNEELATWEPPLESRRIHRPELFQITE